MKNILSVFDDGYRTQHDLDIQDSNDLKRPGIVEREIAPEIVKALRNSIQLNHEMFALLLGVNLTTILRYESISVPPYPQGAVSRKLCILSSWMADPTSSADIIDLLGREGGLATMSGLLQTESVGAYLSLAKSTEKAAAARLETVYGMRPEECAKA